jgi:type IV pilus assembly protein PilA
MLDKIRERRENEEGFTLIELMVVVLIIAILLAIAIPTFLGARNRANDRAAQSSLRNALTAAKVLFTDQQDYDYASISALMAEEPAITFQTGSSTGPKVVSVQDRTVGDAIAASVWYGAAFSKSGTCFRIFDNSAAGGSGTTYSKVTGATETTCAVDTSVTYSAGAWG